MANARAVLSEREHELSTGRARDGARATTELAAATARAERLQAELVAATTARAEAVAAAAAAEAASATHAEAAANLAVVLEAFQATRSADDERAVAALRTELADVKAAAAADAAAAKALTTDAVARADAAAGAVAEVAELRGHLTRLAEERVELRSQLEASLSRVHRPPGAGGADGDGDGDGDGGPELVDRRVVRQLVVSYFGVASRRRRDVLQLLSRVLAFGHADLVAVGLVRRPLGDVLTSLVPAPPPSADGLPGGGLPPVGSVADNWVEFLMKQTEPDDDF